MRTCPRIEGADFHPCARPEAARPRSSERNHNMKLGLSRAAAAISIAPLAAIAADVGVSIS